MAKTTYLEKNKLEYCNYWILNYFFQFWMAKDIKIGVGEKTNFGEQGKLFEQD